MASPKRLLTACVASMAASTCSRVRAPARYRISPRRSCGTLVEAPMTLPFSKKIDRTAPWSTTISSPRHCACPMRATISHMAAGVRILSCQPQHGAHGRAGLGSAHDDDVGGRLDDAPLAGPRAQDLARGLPDRVDGPLRIHTDEVRLLGHWQRRYTRSVGPAKFEAGSRRCRAQGEGVSRRRRPGDEGLS